MRIYVIVYVKYYDRSMDGIMVKYCYGELLRCYYIELYYVILCYVSHEGKIYEECTDM